MKKTNKLAALGLSAGLLAGAGAGLIVATPGAAGAQESSTRGGQPTSQSARGDKLKEVLASLVTDGTLTQAQSDKVLAAIQAARPAQGEGPRGGRGIGGRERPGLTAAVSALGITEDELRAAFQQGKSIAAIADDKNIDLDDVKQAMLDEAKAKQAERVAAGEITQEQADERYAKLEERIDDIVNRTPQPRGDVGQSNRGGTRGEGRGQRATPGTVNP
jgi:hypothetical protein